MKEIQAPKVAAMEFTLVNQIEPVNFDWLPRTYYLLDLFENFITQTRRKCTNFPTSFIEFGPWMQKLQKFELNLNFVRTLLVPLGG